MLNIAVKFSPKKNRIFIENILNLLRNKDLNTVISVNRNQVKVTSSQESKLQIAITNYYRVRSQVSNKQETEIHISSSRFYSKENTILGVTIRLYQHEI